ncbi:MAG: 4Fe-4S binding protein, partial [Alistipes sp.]|nr:4Fe-4S binding protein [Alistipes sp.]
MKRKPNYLKHLLQWGVLAAIVGTVLWAKFSDKPVDVEAYCPFGGLQAFGTYLVNNSLACSMSMLQIMMGLVLAVGVILFSKLFCGYLCPLGTVGEWMGRAGKKLHLQVDVPSGSVVDKLLRVVKYVLLFTILYFTLSSSELFCKKLDPFYAVATGFKGEIVLWMSLTSLTLLLLGGFVVKMFWCKYICPLGAV